MTCQINEFSQLKEGMTNIHYEGNETLEPNILPSSLHSIIFGHKFNNGTDYWAVVKKPLSVGIFPDELQHITFGTFFNNSRESLCSGVFPNKLQSITFGEKFESTLLVNSFPNSLQSIVFGYCFDNGYKPLQPGVFPDGLKSIEFGYRFCNGNQPIQFGVLPNGLKSVVFGNWFNNGGQPLQPGILPDSLQSIVFGCHFCNGNQPLQPGVLPSGLKSIIFGNWFNNGGQPLQPGVFPDELQSIVFGEEFTNGYQPIQQGVLPNNLQSVDFGNKFTNGGKKFPYSFFPETLSTLVVSKETEKMHSANLDSNPNWWYKYRIENHSELTNIYQLISNTSRYHNIFKPGKTFDLDIVNMWINNNQFEVVNLVDVGQLVDILIKIEKCDQIEDQERIKLVTNYLQLLPSEITIGITPSRNTVNLHYEFWNKIPSTEYALYNQKTFVTHPKHDVQIKLTKLFYESFHEIDNDLKQRIKITNIFKIGIPIQEYLWKNRKNKTQKCISVWHGTKACNILSILRSGFTPLNTPTCKIYPSKSGEMFGSGIYLTDYSSKALYYSDQIREKVNQNSTGWLFLGTMDPGYIYRASKFDVKPDYTLPDMYDSLYADPSCIRTIKRSERVIYNPSRIDINYLFQVAVN